MAELTIEQKALAYDEALDCAHHVSNEFLVTDDPYPIHNTEDFCKLGKYDNTWLAPEKKVSLCEHCKRFCASRPMIRKQRERKALLKELESDSKKNYYAAVREDRLLFFVK